MKRANKIEIKNMVASTTISNELNLDALVVALPDTEYEPEQFPGLVMRVKEPKAAVLLFSSGKAVCAGARSFKDIESVIDQVRERLKSIGFEVKPNPKIQVQNIVASTDLHIELNLNSIAVGLGLDQVEYEPEQFPGLVYRLPESKIVILLFTTGKAICLGARKREEIEEAVSKLEERLKLLTS